jgi:RNA polymerase sigma-70 factor (ECF subfamily)
MMTTANVFLFNTAAIGSETSDEELVRSVLSGDTEHFAALMRRHSQRLYRVARSIVADDAQAIEAVQEAFLRAYRHLGQFKGDVQFVTWLTKLAIYEALMWRQTPAAATSPRMAARRRGLVQQSPNPGARMLEEAIDWLPTNYRTVFVLRDIEKLSADETAASLLLSSQTVETRLMRSRRMLQERLGPNALDHSMDQALSFGGGRTAGLIDSVMRLIAPRAGESATEAQAAAQRH